MTSKLTELKLNRSGDPDYLIVVANASLRPQRLATRYFAHRMKRKAEALQQLREFHDMQSHRLAIGGIKAHPFGVRQHRARLTPYCPDRNPDIIPGS